MYVLIWAGQPIACAERFERLSEHMTLYTPSQQADMHISTIPLLD